MTKRVSFWIDKFKASMQTFRICFINKSLKIAMHPAHMNMYMYEIMTN